MARTVKAGRNARWLVEIRSTTATHRESERASPSRSAGRRGSATREVFAQNQLTESVVESAGSPAPEADDARDGAAATRLDLQSFNPFRAGVAAIDPGARDGSKVDDRAPACQGGDARRTRRGLAEGSMAPSGPVWSAPWPRTRPQVTHCRAGRRVVPRFAKPRHHRSSRSSPASRNGSSRSARRPPLLYHNDFGLPSHRHWPADVAVRADGASLARGQSLPICARNTR